MELIIFVSLYQVKEGLIFYIHSFIEELSIYVMRQSGIPFLLYKKRLRRREIERSANALRGHSAPRGQILRIVVAFILQRLLVIDSPLFSHYIDMH